jgi:hypothetical protein
MTANALDAVSILALDLGSVNTRANLFDVADGQYRFIASGISPSTVNAPYFDIGEGIYQALDRLQAITGKILLDRDANIILPSQAGGEGVDRLVVTYSCGKPLDMVTFGLLGDASLESVNRLASSVPGQVLESFGINDSRTADAKVEAILTAKPDLILFAGGSDNGASRSVLKIADLICNVLRVMPAGERPEVVFVGNQAVAPTVKDKVERFSAFHVLPNVRPQIDLDEAARVETGLSSLVNQVQSRFIHGLDRISTICNAAPEPSTLGAEKIVRFLSATNDPQKGVLAFDIGGASSVAISGQGGETRINGFPFGSGFGLENFLKRVNVEKILPWVAKSMPLEDLRDALYQKTLSPTSIPESREALDIELAVARVMLREMVRELRLRGTLTARGYDPILVSGSTLTRAASPQQTLLTLLDGIQPAGITTLILDKHSIIQSLGVAGLIQPYLPVQVLESTAFTSLATVVSLVSESPLGKEILNARLEYENGKFVEVTVSHGSIIALPLRPGESGKLYLEPQHRTRIEASGLVEDFYKVNGGILGLVIDARGRPLEMPSNDKQRDAMVAGWVTALGG